MGEKELFLLSRSIAINEVPANQTVPTLKLRHAGPRIERSRIPKVLEGPTLPTPGSPPILPYQL